MDGAVTTETENRVNWINYDRLVAHLKTMDARQFNYGNATFREGNAGCVACQILGLLGLTEGYSWAEHIESFLGVTGHEAMYLYGVSGRVSGIDVRSTGYDSPRPNNILPSGEFGIREALRRLDVVAARYQRPEGEAPAELIADDAAFLASVRALIGKPLVQA